MVAHTFNPRAWKAQAGGFQFWIQSQSDLQSEFQDGQIHKESLSQKPKKGELFV